MVGNRPAFDGMVGNRPAFDRMVGNSLAFHRMVGNSLAFGRQRGVLEIRMVGNRPAPSASRLSKLQKVN